MKPELWQRVSEIFEAALEQAPGERARFVAEQTAQRPELRAAVERLLAADEQAGAFLERPAAELAGAAPRPPGARPAVIGRYEILETIGRGGFGEVFKARDPGLKRLVAIKTCWWPSGSLKARFAREAEIAARLDHPNITVIFDVGSLDLGADGEVPYLVQEFLDGEDLDHLIASGEPRPLKRSLDILTQVARGLAYAHARGVVHRDIKPGNLRLLPDDRVKIMDFGIARLSGEASRQTAPGLAAGTVAYMAPEQIRGAASDHRVDLFAFGVVAFELLTGRAPFQGESGAVPMYEVLERAPLPLTSLWPACPRELEALVARCLAKEAAERPATAAEVATTLERIAAAVGPELASPAALPESALRLPPTVALRPRPRRFWPVAAALALLPLGWWLAGLLRRPAPPPAAPPPAVAQGWVQIDAVPWGEVVAVTDTAGREVALPGQRFTPLALALPPGRYRITLHNPKAAALESCELEVVSGSRVACRATFERVEVRAFLRQMGL